LELSKNVEFRRQRGAVVQILGILPRPEERLSRGALEPFAVDLLPAKNAGISVGKIISHDTNQMHRREKTGRNGEISRRSTQRAIDFPVWAFDADICHGTYDE